MIKRIHVYDLDGVLVDSSHRYRNTEDGVIDLDYWFANRTAEKIAKDKLLPLSKQYRTDCLNPECYVILCTSRAEHKHDIRFILSRLGKPNKLIMRPAGNTEADSKLKRKQLNRLFNLRQFQKLPRKLWEDNQRNIAALQSLFDYTFYISSKQGHKI